METGDSHQHPHHPRAAPWVRESTRDNFDVRLVAVDEGAAVAAPKTWCGPFIEVLHAVFVWTTVTAVFSVDLLR